MLYWKSSCAGCDITVWHAWRNTMEKVVFVLKLQGWKFEYNEVFCPHCIPTQKQADHD